MDSALPPDRLETYLLRQLATFFPDDAPGSSGNLRLAVDRALAHAEICFAKVRDPRFRRDGAPFFDHLHSDQNSMFLYWVAHEAGKLNLPSWVPTKLYLLNKALHGLDVFHEVELPAIFLFGHAIGSVLGRAQYDDFLVVTQNCTVGGVGSDYPVIGRGVVMSSGVNILGSARIGDDVYFGAGAMVVNESISGGTTVVGRKPHLRIWPSKRASWREFFLS